jgi:ADP-heptose:LPS heptosyltransferase
MKQDSTNASAPRILISRFGKIGDCVMASYAVTALRQAVPEATIVWVVESSSKDIISSPELATDTWVCNRDRLRKQKRYAAAQLDFLLLCRRIRGFRFDYAFDLHGHAKTAIATSSARASRTFALQRKDPVSKVLLPAPPQAATEGHWVERFHAVVRKAFDAPLPERPILPRSEQLDLERFGIDCNRPYAVISAGGRDAYKRYPEQKWEVVIDELREMGLQVALNGFAKDPQPASDRCINLVGKLTLRESCELLARAEIHLGADNGAGHIAAAFGTPTIAIFGPMNPAQYRPYGDKSVALKVSGSPEDVPTDLVLSSVRQLIRDRTLLEQKAFQIVT